MGIREFREKINQPLPRAGYTKTNLIRVVLFIPIALIFIPLGAWLGINYYQLFATHEYTWLIHPVFAVVLIALMIIPLTNLEVRHIWIKFYPEMTGSWYAPFEAPISSLILMGFGIVLVKGPDVFSPVTEYLSWFLSSL